MHSLFNVCTLGEMDTKSSTFLPSQYPDTPLYNIQAVAAATGVPSITLRSWERRYGVPVPKRDAKGYRLYSERDVAVARWLRERVQQGVGISRAVHMLRLLDHTRSTPEPVQPFDFAGLQVRLIQAIRRLDEQGVGHVVADALMVASVEEVALQLLQPTLYEVGDLWARGELSVTSEHVGSNVIRSHLAQLIRISPLPLRSERILVGCAPGEWHDIGALMLALFARRRGYDVVYLGSSVESVSLQQDVHSIQPAGVCLSAGTIPAARNLKDLYQELSASYHGVLGFGGRAFNEDASLCDAMPGTWLGPDAGSAVARLDTLFAR